MISMGRARYDSGSENKNDIKGNFAATLQTQDHDLSPTEASFDNILNSIDETSTSMLSKFEDWQCMLTTLKSDLDNCKEENCSLKAKVQKYSEEAQKQNVKSDELVKENLRFRLKIIQHCKELKTAYEIHDKTKKTSYATICDKLEKEAHEAEQELEKRIEEEVERQVAARLNANGSEVSTDGKENKTAPSSPCVSGPQEMLRRLRKIMDDNTSALVQSAWSGGNRKRKYTRRHLKALKCQAEDVAAKAAKWFKMTPIQYD